MSEAIEKIKNEAVEEAVLLEKYEIALSMLAKEKYSHEEIAEITGLSLEDVEELAKQKPVNA